MFINHSSVEDICTVSITGLREQQGTFVSKYLCGPFGICPSCIAWLCSRSLCSFLTNNYTDFHNGCISLHSHGCCMYHRDCDSVKKSCTSSSQKNRPACGEGRLIQSPSLSVGIVGTWEQLEKCRFSLRVWSLVGQLGSREDFTPRNVWESHIGLGNLIFIRIKW